MDQRSENELLGGGDTRLHFHLADRGPFPIVHGSFYDTTTQSIASTTAEYAVTFSSTSLSKGVAVQSNSRIVVSAEGVYNFQFSAQLQNTNIADNDVDIWFKKNGVVIANSNTIVTVPSSHGGTPGHCVPSWNFFLDMNRNDYFEIFWHADSLLVSMPSYAAAITPTRPATPSVILTANLVSI